jgi:DNA-directed RNA polymerase specialized sigma24 family protein
MGPAPSRRPRWSLTPGALDRLLRQLAPDPEEAGQEYERLRRRLIHFFERRRCAAPDDLADQALDRLARRLDEGAEVRDAAAFLHGIAMRVWQESWRSPPAGAIPMASGPDEEAERQDRCLGECLSQLETGDRDVLLRYYDGDRRQRIEGRSRLAAELAVSPNALRIRTHHLRQRLESCVRACLDRAGNVRAPEGTSHEE